MSEVGSWVWQFLTNEVLWSAVVWGVLAALFKAWKEWRGDLPDYVKVGASVVLPIAATYALYHLGVWAEWWVYDKAQLVASLEMAVKAIVGSKGIFAVTRGVEEKKGLKQESGSTTPGQG